MKAKFTPGEWIAVGQYVFALGPQDSRKAICRAAAIDLGNHEIEAEANARLIAAAPEMAELLARIVESDLNVPALIGYQNQSRLILACIEGGE